MRRLLTAVAILNLVFTAAPRRAAATEPPLFAPFSTLGLTEPDVGLIDDATHEVDGDTTFFRHASDVGLEPTLSTRDNPDVVPLRVGSAELTWAPQNLPQLDGGFLWVEAGDGLQPDREYAVFWAQMAGPLDIAEVAGVRMPPMMYQQISFAIDFPDREGWQPHADSPFDTWRDGAVIVSLTYGPDPWQVDLFEVGDDGELQSMPFNGFAAGIEDTWIIAFESASFFPEGAFPGYAGFRFANGKHDGSFGFCDDCLAIHGATPGGYDGDGFTDHYPIIDVGTIEAGATPAPSTTTTTTSSTTPAETTTTAAAKTTTTSAAPVTTTVAPTTAEEGGFPWGWLIGGGGVLIGLGWLIYRLAAAAAKRGYEDGGGPR